MIYSLFLLGIEYGGLISPRYDILYRTRFRHHIKKNRAMKRDLDICVFLYKIYDDSTYIPRVILMLLKLIFGMILTVLSALPTLWASANIEDPGAVSVIIAPSKARLFHELIRLEPTAREIQKEVIRYNGMGNGKIARWHIESRLKALLPNLSFGRDYSRSNNIDLDRASTKVSDTYIIGPDEIDWDWSLDLRWDLADLIWSTAQTSIDSRKLLLVGLRSDMLREANRLYYERRHIQIDIVFSPPKSEQEHFKKLNRMDELSSQLDGMTGGKLSRRITEIYAAHPTLEALWHFTPSPGSAAAGRMPHQYPALPSGVR